MNLITISLGSLHIATQFPFIFLPAVYGLASKISKTTAWATSACFVFIVQQWVFVHYGEEVIQHKQNTNEKLDQDEGDPDTKHNSSYASQVMKRSQMVVQVYF